MKRDRGWVVRGAMAAVACGFMLGGGAARGQAAAGAELRQQLNDLAQNPQSVQQLVGTGRAALAVGDAEAAVGFFTRALEIAPADPRAKAGLAAATAQAGQPESALVLFGEAISAGASEADIAGDRGLAYDLTGQSARAQADYTLALRRGDDPEVRRRLALSLAISGQREAALRLLDPQVRTGDRASGRARAMVLALGGDVNGATNAAQAVMPPGAGQAMAPFFSRLAGLGPAQMAAAVNLGRIPAAGGTAYAASTGRSAPDPGALAFAGSADGTRPLVRNRVEEPLESDRRRPGYGEPTRVAANPVTEAGRPRGSWPGITEGRPPAGPGGAVVGSAAAVVLPHPGQPFAGTLREAVAPAPVSETAAADAVPFAGGVVASASRPEAVATQPVVTSAQAAGQELDGAAANLAVWNRSGPVAPSPMQPVATRLVSPTVTSSRPSVSRRMRASETRSDTGGPNASFSDVASTVTNLDTAREGAARSRYRSRRGGRSLVASPVVSASESGGETTRSGSRSGRRSWRGLTRPAAVETTNLTTAGRSRGRRGSRGLSDSVTTNAATSPHFGGGSGTRRGRGSAASTAPTTAAASAARGSSGGRGSRNGATSAGTRTSGYPATTSGRSGRNGAPSAATTNTRGGARTTSSGAGTTTRRGVTSATTGRGASSGSGSAAATSNRSGSTRGGASGRTASGSAPSGRSGTTPLATATSRRGATPTPTSRRPRGR